MDVVSFKTVVDKVRGQQPLWFEINDSEKCNSSQIKQIQKELGVALPDEFILFLEEYGSGLFCFVDILSCSTRSVDGLLDVNNKGYWNKNEFIAVADNDTGDFYGFQVVGNKCLEDVVFWDHETRELLKTSYKNFFEYVLIVGLQQKI